MRSALSVTPVGYRGPAPSTAVDELLNASILIVDDNLTSRLLLQSYLKAHGFSDFVFAADGIEALERMKERAPEVVITDLMMPAMDGYEFIRRVRAEPAHAGVPVIVQTGLDEADDRARVFQAGASDLITKPINAIELVGRVRVHLERRRLLARLVEAQRRMEEELGEARKMQESLLPAEAELDRLIATHPLDVAGFYQASVGLGGDIWGMFGRADGRVVVYTCDFAGHGVQSALNTFRLHAYLKSGSADADDPAGCLARLNAFLCDVLPLGQFATMFMAYIDFAAGRIDYASAASPPPPVRTAAGLPFELLDGSGLPLGVTRLATFDNRSSAFGPGAVLALYSDALIETPAPPAQIFTPEGLRDFLTALPAGASARTIRREMLDCLFLRAAEKPSDDLTLVVVAHTTAGTPGDAR